MAQLKTGPMAGMAASAWPEASCRQLSLYAARHAPARSCRPPTGAYTCCAEGLVPKPQALLPAVQMACPLSFVPLTDPVVLVETGDVYDRQTLSQWLKKHDDCPLTGETWAYCMCHEGCAGTHCSLRFL